MRLWSWSGFFRDLLRSIRRSSLFNLVGLGLTTGILWTLGTSLVGSARLPGPGAIARLFFRSFFYDPVIEYQGGGGHGFLPHIGVTLINTVASVSFGAVIGFLIATVCSVGRVGFAFADTAVEVVRVVPPLLLIPLLTIVESGSYFAQVTSVGLYSMLLIFIYTVNALRQVPANYIALSALLGAGKWRSMFFVQVPSIIPHLLGAIRLVFALGFGISIVGEYLVSPMGIGRVMLLSKAFSAVDLILVGVFWTIVLALLVDSLLLIVFGRLIRWTERRHLVEWLAR